MKYLKLISLFLATVLIFYSWSKWSYGQPIVDNRGEIRGFG